MTGFSDADKRRIAASIHEKYDKAAVSPEGLFRFPTGRQGLDKLGYDKNLTGHLDDQVAASYCGVGNPFAPGLPMPGQTVLDVGCGAGVDALIAARLTAPHGSAVGLEFSPAMRAKAQANAKASGLTNVRFVEGSGENLPFEEQSFDLAISNGAINLIVDKRAALKELWRVLKPGGKLQIADQMLTGQKPQTPEQAVACWFR